MLANSALWAVAVAWLLMSRQRKRADGRIDQFLCVSPPRSRTTSRCGVRSAFVALGLLYLSTLAADPNGSRFELVAVTSSTCFSVSLAVLRSRSHAEYRQRLDPGTNCASSADLFERQSRRDGLTGLANRRLGHSPVRWRIGDNSKARSGWSRRFRCDPRRRTIS